MNPVLLDANLGIEAADELKAHLAGRLADRDAVQSEQGLGALDGVAQRPPRLVHRRRLLEGRAPLARVRESELVGVQGARELAMGLFQRREVEVEPTLDAEQRKGVHDG